MKGKKWFKFLFPFFLGVVFFFLPLKYSGKLTVPFDILVSLLRNSFPRDVGIYTIAVLLTGVVLSIFSPFFPFLKKYKTSFLIYLLRILGGIIAICLYTGYGPRIIMGEDIRNFMMNLLIPSVAVIIPIGASVVNMLTSTGTLDFVGTLSRPIMRPGFKVPGRAALDILTSWVGSYSVGLYITRNVFLKGGYSKREAFIIATSFSTVSIGFVGVVASTLKILNLFPLVFIGYFFAVFITGAIIVRIPPTSKISGDYLTIPIPEAEAKKDIFREAVNQALVTASRSSSLISLFIRGFFDGLFLASLILSTIASVGTIAIVLAKYTPIFNYLALPFYPIYKLIGLPQPMKVSIATVIEVAEMYLPTIAVKDAPLVSRFFIAVLSTSQLIFFSSVGPMIMDMFREIPIKFSHLLILFIERTIILIPIVGAYTYIIYSTGLLR